MRSAKVRYSIKSFPQKSRSLEFPIIRRERILLLKSLIGRDSIASTSYFELTITEFIIFATVQHANLNYLIFFLNTTLRYGAMPTSIVFTIFQLIFGFPLSMLYFFLSSYTKRSFFTIWECVPIVEGFGLTLAMAKLLYVMSNVTIATYSVSMLIELVTYQLTRIEDSCSEFDEVAKCATYGASINLSCTNTNNTGVLVGTQYYFRINLLNYDQFNSECCEFNLRLFVIFTALWLLVFLVCIFGLERIVKIMFKAMLIAILLLFVVSLYLLSSADGYPKMPDAPPLPFGDFNFWIQIILHTNTPTMLSHTFWFGTMLSKDFSPRTAAMVLTFTKCLSCLVVMCFSSVILHEILYNYKFEDPNCIIVHGADIIIAFVPDILLQLHFGLLISFFWYISIITLTLSNPIFCVTAIVNSLCEHKPSLNSRRIFVFMTLCICGILISLPYCLNIGFILLSFFWENGMLLIQSLFILLVTITIIFLYSIARIVEDYTFTYGVAPHIYFTALWGMIPVITLYLFILISYKINLNEDPENSNKDSKSISISSFITMFLLLIPIFFVALLKIFQQLKYRSLGNLLRPVLNWGPFLAQKRHERKLYFPQRELKYRLMCLRCTHNCLAESRAYNLEHSKQITVLHRFVAKHKEHLDPNITNFIITQYRI